MVPVLLGALQFCCAGKVEGQGGGGVKERAEGLWVLMDGYLMCNMWHYVVLQVVIKPSRL